MDLSGGEVSTVADHCSFEVFNEVVTDSLFELAGADIFVEIDNFFVQAVES